MNKQAVLDLAAFIEKADYKFDMCDYKSVPQCGSAGCIGGHAAVLWPEIGEQFKLGMDTYSIFLL